MKRLLAAVAVATAFAPAALAQSASASAQPCVAPASVGSVCYLDSGPAGRGALVSVYSVNYAFVLVGCYYPNGSARYYIGVGTRTTGLIHVDAPVGGVPCV